MAAGLVLDLLPLWLNMSVVFNANVSHMCTYFMFIMYTQKCSVVVRQLEPLLRDRQIYIPGFPPAAPLTCHSSNSCV